MKDQNPSGCKGPRLCPFEEPAGADAQPVMPGWQSRRIHREPRLPRERACHYFPRRQNCGVFGAETERFTKFNEMFCR
jgi:hypothetical protein